MAHTHTTTTTNTIFISAQYLNSPDDIQNEYFFRQDEHDALSKMMAFNKDVVLKGHLYM